mmetsp:Transcript_52928/g.123909  ORF Transcript_52928/g.123909 Transcript_52928/m.123909 type:complete len:440 (-) Transcript_52928:76-1395(-)
MPTGDFKDHYEYLSCSPDTPLADLKRAYHEKLREYHPDKRPDSPCGIGQRITQALTEAWEVLSDPAKKEVYDAQWRREKVQSIPPEDRGDYFRRQGNDAYKAAQDACRQQDSENLVAATVALQKYQAAIALYTQGIELAPQDHRLWSNRALCWGAVRSWGKCREDAKQVTVLKPSFVKGWFLWAKALWKEGQPDQAQAIIDRGLVQVPGHAELIALASELQPDLEAMRQHQEGRSAVHLPNLTSQRGGAQSRNVSPCYTPSAAPRVVTPPPVRKASRSQSQGPSGCPPIPPRQGQSRSPGRRFQEAYEATFDAPNGRSGRHGRSSAREKSRDPAGGGRMDATARFGAGRSQSPNPGGRGRSNEPAAYAHESTFGTNRSPPAPTPPRDVSPPIPPGWPTAPAGPTLESQDPNRQHKVSLAKMAAQGRVNLNKGRNGDLLE